MATSVPEEFVPLTVDEVAALLKVSKVWIYEKTRTRCRDPLPCLRLGRWNRYERAAVIEWARRHGNAAARKMKARA